MSGLSSPPLTDAAIAAVISAATIGNAMAGVTPGAVGSFVFAQLQNTGAFGYGGGISGSSLIPAASDSGGAVGYVQGSALPGSWRALGGKSVSTGYGVSLFQRIA